MKRWMFFTCGAAALGLLCVPSVRAEDAMAVKHGAETPTAAAASPAAEPMSIKLDSTVLSRYVWRGLTPTRDPVWQPTVTASYKGFSLNVWNNLDLGNANDNEGEFNETDVTFNYDRTWQKLTFSVGSIYYAFPNTRFQSTDELYAGVKADVLLQPSFKIFWDVDEIKGAYSTFDLGHSFKLPKLSVAGGQTQVTWSADLATGIGYGSDSYNQGYFGVREDGFVDYHACLNLPFHWSKHWTFTPTVGYSNLVDRDLRTKHTTNWTAGATLSYSF